MIKDKLTYRTHWTIRRFADDAAFAPACRRPSSIPMASNCLL